MEVSDPANQRHRLPKLSTPLFGRARESAGILQLVSDPAVPLVTLTGPGGVGKTRLAIHVAWMAQEQFDGGVAFVRLASVNDPALVLSAIGQALGVDDPGGLQVARQVEAALRDRHTMLLIDNFEHIIAAAREIAELLDELPELTILATSRTPLRISGEHEFPLAPFAIPNAQELTSPVDLLRLDAVQWFSARARAAAPGFALTEANVRIVADICQQLDGLPLAIEMAAARAKVLPPAEMLARLERRLPMLTAGRRDQPERHQTMRATIAWSYDLLSSKEQQFLRQVSCFVGGFTLEAAEAVVLPKVLDTSTALDMVASLVDQSLLRMTAGDAGARYLMLETIREFAHEALVASGEARAVRESHAQWAVRFATHQTPALGPMHAPGAIELTEVEHANIRAALAWAVRQGWADMALSIAVGMYWFWYLAGYTAEGFGWLRQVLAIQPADANHDALRMTLIAAGHLAFEVHDPMSGEWLERARQLSRESGDRHHEGYAVLMLGTLAEDTADYGLAQRLLTHAWSILDENGDQWLRLATDYHLGAVAWAQGDLAEATSRFETVVREGQAAGDTLFPAWGLRYLALIGSARRDVPGVVEAISRMREMTSRSSAKRDDWRDYYETSIALAVTVGEATAAARLLGAFEQESRDARTPPHQRAYLAQCERQVRAALGDQAYHAAHEQGRRTPRLKLAAEADAMLDAARQEPLAQPLQVMGLNLTARELDVLRLLAVGLSNEEIGTRLFISPRTVQVHITHLLAKLGLSNRTEAAAFAHTHRLV